MTLVSLQEKFGELARNNVAVVGRGLGELPEELVLDKNGDPCTVSSGVRPVCLDSLPSQKGRSDLGFAGGRVRLG